MSYCKLLSFEEATFSLRVSQIARHFSYSNITTETTPDWPTTHKANKHIKQIPFFVCTIINQNVIEDYPARSKDTTSVHR